MSLKNRHVTKSKLSWDFYEGSNSRFSPSFYKKGGHWLVFIWQGLFSLWIAPESYQLTKRVRVRSSMIKNFSFLTLLKGTVGYSMVLLLSRI